MLIKTIILLLHISTNSVLQIGIMSYTFDNNEYTIINLFVGFFAGIVILFIDFFLCRGLIMRESKNSKKTAVIHFSDLVLSFPPLVLLVYYAATAGMHGNSSAVNLDFGYNIVLTFGSIVIEVGLFLDRVFLCKRSKKWHRYPFTEKDEKCR